MAHFRKRSGDSGKRTTSLRGNGKEPDKHSENPIYGVGTIDPDTMRGHPSIALAKNAEEWREIYDRAVRFVTGSLAIHDPFEIVANTSCQVLLALGTKERSYLTRRRKGGSGRFAVRNSRNRTCPCACPHADRAQEADTGRSHKYGAVLHRTSQDLSWLLGNAADEIPGSRRTSATDTENSASNYIPAQRFPKERLRNGCSCNP
jgi:hypothetical protein